MDKQLTISKISRLPPALLKNRGGSCGTSHRPRPAKVKPLIAPAVEEAPRADHADVPAPDTSAPPAVPAMPDAGASVSPTVPATVAPVLQTASLPPPDLSPDSQVDDGEFLSNSTACRCYDCRHVDLNKHSPDVGWCLCHKGLGGYWARARHRCPAFESRTNAHAAA